MRIVYKGQLGRYGDVWPFAVVIDRMCAKDGRPHRLSIHYQMDKNGYTVDGKHFRMEFGDGVTMSLISSVVPAIVIGQKEPFWMGWQPKFAAGGIEPEHYPAPCVRYIAESCTSYRFGTVLYPSDNGEVMIGGIALSPDPNDTKFTLLFNNKSEITLDEADFPAAEVLDMQEG